VVDGGKPFEFTTYEGRFRPPDFARMDTMSMNRRRLLSLATASLMLPLAGRDGRAEAYPARPVRIIVGFTPGGAVDIAARLIGDWLQARLGQPIIVENRPGGGYNIATEAVVRSPADGYTLLLTSTSNLLNGALYADLKYDFIRDIAPVASLMVTPLVFETVPGLPVKSVPEFIAYAKSNPGKVIMAIFGTGTVSHLAAEAFSKAAGIDFTYVPYRGSSQMVPDLLAGRVHAAFDTIPGSIEQIKAGNMRALAVSSATRSAVLPDVPPIGDFVSGYEVIPIAGVGAPKGTPTEVIAVLNREINAALADPKIKARLEELGAIILSGSADDFTKLIARETEKWAKLIKASGAKVN